MSGPHSDHHAGNGSASEAFINLARTKPRTASPKHRGNGSAQSRPSEKAGEGNSPEPEDTAPAWTERAIAFWDKLPAHDRALFHSPSWATRAPSESVLDLVRLTHGKMALDDLLSMATFADGFGSAEYGEFHRKTAREQWDALDKPEIERKRLLDHTSVTALLHRDFPPEEQLLGSLVTPTSRMFLVGPTGAGKTMVALAMAGGIVSKQGFLAWRTDQTERPLRALHIDGEMPLPLLQQRMADLARRLGYNGEIPNLHYVSWQEADGLLPGVKWGPLNTPEGQDFILKLCDIIRPDVVIFDNVQSLVIGDMTTETPWNETMPLVLSLTARRIGQVWCDHTGHDETRQYGSSRKAWPFDTVAIINAVTDTAPGELAVSLSFPKARRRTPDNWHDYAPRVIRLREDQWSCDAGDTTNGTIVTKASRGRPKKVDSYAMVARRLLADLLATPEGSKGHGVRPDLPSATEDAWKVAFYDRSGADPTDRKAFWRVERDLIAAGIVAKRDGRVWLTHPERDGL